MKPRIKDVAIKCNVSTTTVSLVLNDKPNRISEETKALIKKVALEMNYRPNLLSRSLVTKKLGIIGIIIPNIKGFFYGEFIQDLINNLEENGYTVLLSLSNFDLEIEKASILKFLDYGVEAIILIGANTNKNSNNNESIDILAKSKIPFLIIGGYEIESEHNTISIDHVAAGYMAAKHLLELGHRRIGLVSNGIYSIFDRFWIEGYKSALNEFQLDYDEDLILLNIDKESSQILDVLISKNATSIIIAGEIFIYDILRRAKEISVHIPEDISIIAIGNSYSYDYICPRVTSIIFPTKIISQDMHRLLVDLKDTPNRKFDCCYKPMLHIRDSTRAL